MFLYFYGGKTPSFFTYFIAKSQYGLCGLKPFPPLIWIPAYVSACIHVNTPNN